MSHIYCVKKSCVENTGMAFWLVGMMVFPLFPTVMGSSHLHIQFLILLSSLIIILLSDFRIDKLSFFSITSYYVLIQSLSVIASLTGEENLSGFFGSLVGQLRPALLYFNVLAFSFLLFDIKGKECVLLKSLLFLFSVNFLYVVFEVFFSGFISSAMYFLYKREGKEIISGIGVGFYGTSYYAGYIACIFLAIFQAKFMEGAGLKWLMAFLGSILLVAFSQSKVMYVTAFLIISCLLCFSSIRNSLIFVICLLVFAMLWAVFSSEIYGFFVSHDSYVIKSGMRLIESPESSGTLNVRVEQILSTYEEIVNTGSFFGIGLGRGVPLESWVASFMYRYGFIGVFAFLFGSIYMAILNYKSSRLLRGSSLGYLAMGLFAWAITLPVSQLSSPMVETSKMAYFSSMCVALTFCIRRYSLVRNDYA